jgi:hypothetical protein
MQVLSMATPSRHFCYVKINLAKIQTQLAAPKKKAVNIKPSPSQKPVVINQAPTQKLELIDSLTAKYAQLKKQRDILSTAIAPLVEKLRLQLHAQSPGMASELMDGKLPMPELADHYKKIVTITEQMTNLWDDIRYVQDHGKLPETPTPSVLTAPSQEVSAITSEIRRLDDLIHKTYKKLGTGKPKNPDRVNEWKVKIALAEAERDNLKRKRAALHYGARAQRAGIEQ